MGVRCKLFRQNRLINTALSGCVTIEKHRQIVVVASVIEEFERATGSIWKCSNPDKYTNPSA